MKPRIPTLKPRLALAPDRVKTQTGSGWRTGKTTTSRGYGYAWQQARERFLMAHPLCAECLREDSERTTRATLVDHIIPHRGDKALFWDEGNWQSLCRPHHDIKTRREGKEGPGGIESVGLEGR